MNCPRDGAELRIESNRRIEIDLCPTCEGHWLDFHERAELEDKVFGKDKRKGTVEYSRRPSDLKCPKCDETLTAFFYRAGRIELDSCPNDHGFWLDKGEDKEVLDFMKDRDKAVTRSATAEANWQRAKDAKGAKGSSGGVFSKIKRFFTGR